ncbi:MAG: uridine phosphorylase [Saprospiraceae bacterium]|jgi:uridine phosphorylase
MIAESELILNPDGSVYHLHLLPEEIAETIITVGDPDRVSEVSKYFDSIEVKRNKREFVTHTGYIGKKRISVISTGIGTDNIDIVFTELDALVNIDLQTREIKEKHTALDLIRIGTSGALQADINVDTFLISSHGLGLGGLMLYYDFEENENEKLLRKSIDNQLITPIPIPTYLYENNSDLADKIGPDMLRGVTATCPGFYAPQGRQLRGKVRNQQMLDELRSWSHEGIRITNFEMETAGIYGMARMLGHRAISCNAILANRAKGEFSKQPKEVAKRLIEAVLQRV